MAQNRRLLFDAGSTDPISGIIAVAPGDCVQINSWNLNPGESAQVFRLLVSEGVIGMTSGSCAPVGTITPSEILAEEAYLPCNVNVEVADLANQNINTIVLQQTGFYRLHLTPAALGTAVVEAITLTGRDACEQAASACCCVPEAWWQGVSVNPCLVITPGGEAGHAPIFDLNACCLFQSLAPNPNPVLTDELIFLSGGNCFRATIDEVFSSAIVCDSLVEQPIVAPAVGDTVVGVDAGNACKRMDGETFVEFFETPWTGISITPALVIAPGGVNGHGPTFSYDLCADIQAQASCACEPNPGDQVLIVQGGACVLATWPTVDVCDQLGLLPNGALIAGDTALVREAGGACKQVLATAFGGGVAFPLLAPDGSCAAPSYSFASSPDSGMFYDPAGVGSVVIGDDNCADFISVGASVVLRTASISLQGAEVTLATPSGTDGALITLIAGENAGGITGGRITVSGGLTVGSVTGGVTLGGGTNGTRTGGSISTGAWFGVTGPPAALIGGRDTAGSGQAALVQGGRGDAGAGGTMVVAGGPGSVANGDVSIVSGDGAFGLLTHIQYVGATGEWLIAASAGLLGQVITSNGAGTPPTWKTVGATPLLAANGSCAAPSYSFSADPDSGIYRNSVLDAIALSHNNCNTVLEVGQSVGHRHITLGVVRWTLAPSGAWNIGGADGVAGQAIVSNGPGVAPTWQTPSGVAEPNTQIVYGTGAAVDSNADNLIDVSNGRVNFNTSAGGTQSAFAVTPAGVRIGGGRNTNAVAGSGGLVQIYGGSMTTALIGTGGQLDFRGGNGGDGGGVELFGGNASGRDRPPGLVNIRGGNNTNAIPDAGNRGGGVTINGGSGGAGGRGGNILIQGGNDGAGVSPATNNVSIGFDAVDGVGTAISLFANPATVSRWTGGTGVPTVTKGQDIQIEAGSGDPATLTSDSGDLFLGTGIRGGHPAGTGEYGHIVVYGATTPVGRPLADFNATTGDVCLAGSGGPAPGSANTTLPAATTGGFTWLPKIAGPPTGVPNGVNFGGGAFGGYANPMAIQETGGTCVLWCYEVGAAAWRSVTLV